MKTNKASTSTTNHNIEAELTRSGHETQGNNFTSSSHKPDDLFAEAERNFQSFIKKITDIANSAKKSSSLQTIEENINHEDTAKINKLEKLVQDTCNLWEKFKSLEGIDTSCKHLPQMIEPEMDNPMDDYNTYESSSSQDYGLKQIILDEITEDDDITTTFQKYIDPKLYLEDKVELNVDLVDNPARIISKNFTLSEYMKPLLSMDLKPQLLKIMKIPLFILHCLDESYHVPLESFNRKISRLAHVSSKVSLLNLVKTIKSLTNTLTDKESSLMLCKLMYLPAFAIIGAHLIDYLFAHDIVSFGKIRCLQAFCESRLKGVGCLLSAAKINIEIRIYFKEKLDGNTLGNSANQKKKYFHALENIEAYFAEFLSLFEALFNTDERISPVNSKIIADLISRSNIKKCIPFFYFDRIWDYIGQTSLLLRLISFTKADIPSRETFITQGLGWFSEEDSNHLANLNIASKILRNFKTPLFSIYGDMGLKKNLVWNNRSLKDSIFYPSSQNNLRGCYDSEFSAKFFHFVGPSNSKLGIFNHEISSFFFNVGVVYLNHLVNYQDPVSRVDASKYKTEAIVKYLT